MKHIHKFKLTEKTVIATVEKKRGFYEVFWNIGEDIPDDVKDVDLWKYEIVPAIVGVVYSMPRHCKAIVHWADGKVETVHT